MVYAISQQPYMSDGNLGSAGDLYSVKMERVRTACGFALLCVTLFTLVCCMPGCEQEEDRLDVIVQSAPAATRGQMAQDLIAAFQEGKLTFEASLIRAEEMLETDHQDAVEFAGAVLDFAEAIETELPRGAEFELFWRRLGRLAYHGAHRAYTAGDYAAADGLVLAGPARWQRDSYWLAYPNHEILVAFSLAHQGDAKAGIRLLRSRTPMPDAYAEAIDTLVEVDRALLRQRLRENLEAAPGGGDGEMNRGG